MPSMASGRFITLPSELLRLLLMWTVDLPSLYSLICTHPIFHQIFLLGPLQVLNATVKRSVPRDLQALIRWVVILGSLKTPDSLYNQESTPHANLQRFIARYRALHPVFTPKYVPELRKELATTNGPRFVLVTAARIQKLEDICLVRMLGLIDSVALYRPKDPNFKFDCQNSVSTQFPQSELIQNQPLWAPSWIERERVRRALWQLMSSWATSFVFTNGKFLGDIRHCRERWRDYFRTHADFSTGYLIADWYRPFFRGDAIDSVNDTLHELIGYSPTSFFLTRNQDPGKHRITSEHLTQLFEQAKERHFRDRNKFQRKHDRRMLRKSLKRPHCEEHSAQDYATMFYLTHYCGHPVSGWLYKSDFRVFSCLGLSIWDPERLATFRLAPVASADFRENTSLEATSYTLDVQLHIWRSMFMWELNRKQNRPDSHGIIRFTRNANKQHFLWKQSPHQVARLAATRFPSPELKCKTCHLRGHKFEDCISRDPTGGGHEPVRFNSEPYHHNKAALAAERLMMRQLDRYGDWAGNASPKNTGRLRESFEPLRTQIALQLYHARNASRKLARVYSDYWEIFGAGGESTLNDSSVVLARDL